MIEDGRFAASYPPTLGQARKYVTLARGQVLPRVSVQSALEIKAPVTRPVA